MSSQMVATLEQVEARDLAELFHEAGRAHHQSFAATNGEDAEWPRWYAEYLAPKFAQLLGVRYSVATLAELLVTAEGLRQRRAPRTDWPDYYADFFLLHSGMQA